ncbi:MAG: hypothetical protein ACRDOK_27315 [Streptosporangiaceae bacterium]
MTSQNAVTNLVTNFPRMTNSRGTGATNLVTNFLPRMTKARKVRHAPRKALTWRNCLTVTNMTM